MANSLYSQNIDIRIHYRLSTFLRYLIFLFTTKQNIEKKIVNSIGTSIERLNESNGITENIGNELREERSPFRFRAAILDSFFLQGRRFFLGPFRNAEPNVGRANGRNVGRSPLVRCFTCSLLLNVAGVISIIISVTRGCTAN